MAEVQTPAGASAKDAVLITLSFLVLLAGIVGFYWFDEQALPIRVVLVVAGLAAAAGLMWFSWYGREFWQFAQAARVELRKVVWPTRQETGMTTLAVFVFVIVAGTFFWVLDVILSWATRSLTGQGG